MRFYKYPIGIQFFSAAKHLVDQKFLNVVKLNFRFFQHILDIFNTILRSHWLNVASNFHRGLSDAVATIDIRLRLLGPKRCSPTCCNIKQGNSGRVLHRYSSDGICIHPLYSPDFATLDHDLYRTMESGPFWRVVSYLWRNWLDCYKTPWFRNYRIHLLSQR